MEFNPLASRRARRGPSRGRNYRLLLGLAVLGLGGAAAFEWWLWSGRRDGAAEAAPDIRAASAEVPDFTLPEPQPVVVPAPPPPAATPAAAPEPVEPPTEIGWDIEPPEVDMDWFHDGRLPHLAHGCALRPGASVIRAALADTIESEIGGQARAVVTEDVYDVDRVGRLLVPAGAYLVGAYKGAELDFQDRRVDFVWTGITFPDGRQITLADSWGKDVAGSMGMGGEVTTRWGDLFATAALLTVFDGLQRGGTGNDATLADGLQRSASDTAGDLGREVTGRVFDWEPRIRIPAGTQLTVSPSKTIQVCEG